MVGIIYKYQIYLILIINLQSLMESQQKHVIHLYEFEQQSVNEKQLSKLILDSLKSYFGEKSPQIKIIGRPHKYWAYFEIDPETAEKLNDLKSVKIGDNNLNIGRYYYDYQIFINKLDPSITRAQVIEYFQQFGEVVDIVITDPADKKNLDFKHCYIKMKDDKTIDRVVLAKIHKIQGKQIKPVRTFGLEEDKESDKKLFLKIQGNPDSFEDFEQNAIEFFMKHGKIRERPRIESTNSQKFKMIVTYTSPKDAAKAMQAFPGSSLQQTYQEKNINLNLYYFHSKQNKIYVGGIKENISQAAIREAFEVFGEISEISFGKGKIPPNSVTAVIGYANQNDFKMALACYTQQPKITNLFISKPYVTIFMNVEQKKSFMEMKKKQQNQASQPARFNNFVPMGGYFGPPPPEPMVMGQLRPMPMMQPGQPMMQPGVMPNPNMINIKPMPAQFNQPPMMAGNFPKQNIPPTRN